MRALALLAFAVSLSLSSTPAWAQAEPLDPWPELKPLIDDQKYAEALRAVEKRLSEARTKRDDAAIGRALVRAADLRISLGQMEGAIHFLRKEPWPQELKARAVVQLFYAQALNTWARQYRYELGRRTPMNGEKGPETWTEEEAFAELHKTFVQLFERRDELAKIPIEAVSDFISPNNFPRTVRSSLRDAVVYLFAANLVDTSGWSVDDNEQAELLKLDNLLLIPRPAVVVADGTAHPFVRAMALLAEHENFHRAANRKEAAIEARRQRLLLLWTQFEHPEDRQKLRRQLEADLAYVEGLPWWTMGQATLGDFLRDLGELRRAHEVYARCEKTSPGSMGSGFCKAHREELEQPSLRLTSMNQDGPNRRSLQLEHTNMGEVFFRAYRFDVDKALRSTPEDGLTPDQEQLAWMLAKEKPVAAWREALPKTTDFRSHLTFVTPKVTEKGSYVIFASPSDVWTKDAADVSAVVFTISDLVLLTSATPDGRLAVRAVSGETGAPLSDVKLKAISENWNNNRFVELSSVTTDAQGRAEFKAFANRYMYDVVLVARRGSDISFSGEVHVPWRDEVEDRDTAALIYTDRTIYRPGQTLQFKVVLFRYDWRGKVSYEVKAKQPVSLTLTDGNGQAVSTVKVVTNAYGSASGKLELPAGRRLGNWSLSTNIGDGSSSIRVEEYKRPTFETTFEPAGEMRLNQPAKVQGQAHYYFGQPVRGAKVKWTVVRLPGWQPYFWGYRPPEPFRILGSGTATTGEDGKFSFEFTPAADERRVRTHGLLYSYKVQVTVLDEGGESHDEHKTFPIGLVAVKASIGIDNGFFVADAPTAPVPIRRTTLDGAPKAGKGSWTLSALAPPYDGLLPADLPLSPTNQRGGPRPPPPDDADTTPGDTLRPRWSEYPSTQDQLHGWKETAEVAKGELNHGADGGAELLLPKLKAGAYRLRYVTKDDRGEEAVAQMDLTVADKAYRPRLGLQLELEQATVEVSGTARIFASSGLPGVPLTLELVRRDGKVERRVLDGRSSAIIELPIRPEDRGGVAISLSAVKDHQLMSLSAFLVVPFRDRELDVTFSTFRDELRPGVRETWKVTVTPQKGEARAAAEVLAYMYDRSLDVFVGHSPPSASSYLPESPLQLRWESQVAMFYATGVFYSPRATSQLPTVEYDQLKTYARWPIGGPGYRRGPCCKSGGCRRFRCSRRTGSLRRRRRWRTASAMAAAQLASAAWPSRAANAKGARTPLPR